MITAICMNPSFDRTVEVDAIAVGAVNRIKSSRTDLGGKGVNVARVVKRLGQQARCIGIAGQENADTVDALLREDGIDCRMLTVPGAVRINTKVVSLDGQPVTELNERGPQVSANALRAFFDLSGEAVEKDDWCVLTGSLPPGCPEGTYRDLIRSMPGVRCVLDVSGKELLHGLEAHPWLVKPNRDELRETLGQSVQTMEEVLAAAQTLMTMGAEHVLVSLGGDGAVLVTPDGAWFAPAVETAVRSTVGAGDAMVGGLLCGLQTTGNLVDALSWAVAAGTASVMTEGTQLVRVEDFEHILPLVRLQKL